MGLTVFGLMTWAITIYLKNDDQTIAVQIDEEWLAEQGGELTLDVDGDKHILIASGLDLEVALGEHGFSVRQGDTVVHNPQTFAIEKEGRQVLHIDANGMNLVGRTPPTNDPASVANANGDQTSPDAKQPPTSVGKTITWPAVSNAPVIVSDLESSIAQSSGRGAGATTPEGFRSIFNGRNLTGWYGLNPHESAKLQGERKKANIREQRADFPMHWKVENGEFINGGSGPYATTDEEFGDIELLIEYRTVAGADSGIYLRGTPQIQIWDSNQPFDSKRPTRNPHLGSGGLFNNTPGTSGRDPLVRADKPFGEWNQFRIRQLGVRTSVWLNGKLVVDGAVMESFWDQSQSLPATGPIMLQTHGGEIRWRNLFVRAINDTEAQKILNVQTGEAKDSIIVAPAPAPGMVFTNDIGMTLKRIPAGEFLMGSPDSDKDALDREKPLHRVRITKPFYLQTTEVTQSQWKAVMRTAPWKGRRFVREGSDYPATDMSWDDAADFCRKLSQRDGAEYRLPTEAEWEYACRSGSTSIYSFGSSVDQLGQYAWYHGNARGINEMYAHRVAQKRANKFGLYDMHGNVWEWCSDWNDDDYYKSSSGSDPRGASSGSVRVYRGGGWNDPAQGCRSAYRITKPATGRFNNLGFRVARNFIKSAVK